jgi:hypothetical protein
MTAVGQKQTPLDYAVLTHLTLMRPPVVKSQMRPQSGLLPFVPLGCRRSVVRLWPRVLSAWPWAGAPPGRPHTRMAGLSGRCRRVERPRRGVAPPVHPRWPLVPSAATGGADRGPCACAAPARGRGRPRQRDTPRASRPAPERRSPPRPQELGQQACGRRRVPGRRDTGCAAPETPAAPGGAGAASGAAAPLPEPLSNVSIRIRFVLFRGESPAVSSSSW